MKKRIIEKNGQQFWDDYNRVSEVGVLANDSREYFKIRKLELLKAAQETIIYYQLSTSVYEIGRLVMVVV